jgi:dipeptidyl aminopeptidase/acylaminoacyl peptidase
VFRAWRKIAIVVGVVVALYAAASLVVLRIALTPHRATCDDPPNAAPLPLESHDDRTPLHAWLLTPEQPTNKAVVMIHGLDSCGWAGQHIDLAQEYLRKGATVVVFDLRAQGRSGGDQLGLGWFERGDVRAAVDALLARGFQPGAIGIHGSSFGAGTALLATAAIPEVGAVVADSAFADVRDLMSAELDRKVVVGALFAPGVALAARVRYGIDLAEIPPIVAVPKIAPRPILFVHGTADDRIPVEHARRLRAVSKGPNDELWLLDGAGHTQGLSYDRAQFLERTTSFLLAHLREP